MDKQGWEKEYKELLKTGKERGEVRVKTTPDDKRINPRFKLKTGAIWIRMEQSFDVVDVSRSGISFFSNYPFEAGQTLAVTLGKAFMIEAKVKSCAVVETDETFLEKKYRVSCNFDDSYSGVQFLVMLKESENLDIEFPSHSPDQ